MRADLKVAHSELSDDEVLRRLQLVFHAHNPAALDASPYFGTRPQWKQIVLYCSETPDSRIACISSSTLELQVTVETISGDIRQACQTGWSGVRRALRQSGLNRLLHSSRPRLVTASVIDPDTGRDVVEGHSGFGSQIRSRQAVTNLILAGIAIALIVVGLFYTTGNSRIAVIAAGLPGVSVGILTLIFAWLDWRQGALQWS